MKCDGMRAPSGQPLAAHRQVHPAPAARRTFCRAAISLPALLAFSAELFWSTCSSCRSLSSPEMRAASSCCAATSSRGGGSKGAGKQGC